MNTILHILLSKIKRLGASGQMLSWFSSYLDRTQCVRHNGGISTEQIFKCGIPQGSRLGPTLFIFYINDVLNCADRNINIMFADDCVLYKSDTCCDCILGCLQYSLDNYVHWSKENNMYLNTSKTKAIVKTLSGKMTLSGKTHFFTTKCHPKDTKLSDTN